MNIKLLDIYILCVVFIVSINIKCYKNVIILRILVKGLRIIWNLWYFYVIILFRRFFNKDEYFLGSKWFFRVKKKLLLVIKM